MPRWLTRLPIRVRLTAWYAGLLAVILAAVSGFLLLRLRADLVAGVDAAIDERAAQVLLALRGPGEGEFPQVGAAALAGLSRRESAAQLLTPDGRVLERAGDEVAGQSMLDPVRLRQVRPGRRLRATVRLGPDREPFRLLALQRVGAGHRQVLVVATSVEEVDESVGRLRLLLLLAIPGALALASGGGWLLAGLALAPVARMTRQADAIGSDRLHERITVPPARDELARLAGTLNAMLDRLERGVAEQRRLVADASHELRTPLAIMRAELEVGLHGTELPPAAAELLESSAEEVTRMSGVVDDLLTLARADEGRLELAWEPVDLGEVAAAVAGKLRPMAAAKGIGLTVEGDAPELLADRARIDQVVANLVDNAVKYTGPGGTVRVAVWGEPGAVVLAVRDTGPGIPAEALARVFDRFFRIDAARSRAHGGSGLGLAICKEIVEAHGGRIWAESQPGGGSSFLVTLPLQPRPAGAGSAPARRRAGHRPPPDYGPGGR